MKSTLTLFLLTIFLYSCSDKNKKTTNIFSKKRPGIESLDSTSVDSFLVKNPDFKEYRNKIIKFYVNRGFKLAWSKQGEFLPQAAMFLNLVKVSEKDGFDVERFHNKNLRALYTLASDEDNHENLDQIKLRTDLDMLLTSAFFKYAHDEWKGAVDPKKEEWFANTKKIKYGKTLEAILADQKDANPFIVMEPLHKEYHHLKSLLTKYQEIQKRGGWPAIELKDKKKLIKGDTNTAVVNLKKRLQVSGDLTNKNTDSIFDAVTEDAVKKFQTRHGLDIDGVIAGSTLEELNISVEDRIRQIEINMERWRWVPERISDQYIMVNIPEFVLHVYEKDKEVWNMRVIVGKQASHTPIFNDELEYIVINPSWNVPKDISVKEILPLMQKDSTYLKRQRMEMFVGESSKSAVDPSSIDWKSVNPQNFNYRFRQMPGDDNALGIIKFLFPNEYSVYLHDTPTHSLFERSERGFSHGCIRIQNAIKMADYLLRDNPDWDHDKIIETIKSKEEKYIPLVKKIPVYILYFTVWIDPQGTAHFQKDIYGHDKKLEKELFGLK
ncbi:MAG TPA: L,D-transpeptidase family protein [Cytophagaceae bacterium]|jgi:murein L,D-transpeptidase YcbB/YkuD|nr:L,D-transpeptidase family protein [Cytophagaceae bacterium]